MTKNLLIAGAAALALLGGTAFAQDAQQAGGANGDTPAAPAADPAAPPADSPAPPEKSAPASADDIQPADVTDRQDFANMATIANMFEIQSSKLALDKATSDDVRAFAQRMVDDHTKAGEEMKTAAQNPPSVTLPDELDKEHADKIAQLQNASGDAFDKLYVEMQTAAHVQAVALFSGFAQNGPEGALKDFAVKTLPTLKEHYEMVLALSQ